MEDNWIPVRDRLPETEEWVQVQTQDGTIYPAQCKNNQWYTMYRGGLVEQMFHGKVAYWQPHAIGYPYVQCKCGTFYLQAEGRKSCPVCASFGISVEEKPKKPKKEPKKEQKKDDSTEDDIPFTERDYTKPPEGFDDDLIV